MSHTPPGPRGLPVLGDTRRFARDPFGFLEALADAYGDIARFRLGPNTLHLLTDPDDIGEVLVRNPGAYRKADFGDGAVDDLLGDGLLLAEGDAWREQRQVWAPSFNPETVRAMGADMAALARETVAGWRPGETIDVSEELSALTVRIITETMFDVSLSPERAARVGAALEPVGSRFVPSARRTATPDWLPTPEDRRYAESVDTLDDLLDDIVAERTARAGGVPEGEDLLAGLLAAREEGVIDDDLLRDELMTVLLAGHETTALALTYTFHLLARNPGARATLEAAVDEVVGDGEVAARHVPALDGAERVVSEAMRLYPPVFALFREPTEPVRHAGYRVPAGDIVALPQWTVHRDERWWDDPGAFDPDRFTEERSADRPRFAYFPFGGGPRACVGRGFALVEAKLVLAAVTAECRLEAAYEGDPDLEASLTTRPAGPVEMTVRER